MEFLTHDWFKIADGEVTFEMAKEGDVPKVSFRVEKYAKDFEYSPDKISGLKVITCPERMINEFTPEAQKRLSKVIEKMWL